MTDANLSEFVTLGVAAPHIALVTISRPEARNAVNVAVTQGIAKALQITEADCDIWVVVLTGAGGKAFSAGADLKEVAAGRAMSLRTEAGGFAGFTHYLREKPWIAAVEGFALGGGCEIALACDLIVASEVSVFGLPEAKRGLIAGAGGVYRLPRVLPRNIALELISTGAELPAARAYAFGMVNRLVVPGGAVEAAVALREGLKVARASADFDDATLREMTREAIRRTSLSADYQEGPRAFIEKRAPKWLGR